MAFSRRVAQDDSVRIPYSKPYDVTNNPLNEGLTSTTNLLSSARGLVQFDSLYVISNSATSTPYNCTPTALISMNTVKFNINRQNVPPQQMPTVIMNNIISTGSVFNLVGYIGHHSIR